MTYFAFFAGLVLGIIAAVAYNYYRPAKFDKITGKAAAEVKDRLD